MCIAVSGFFSSGNVDVSVASKTSRSEGAVVSPVLSPIVVGMERVPAT